MDTLLPRPMLDELYAQNKYCFVTFVPMQWILELKYGLVTSNMSIQNEWYVMPHARWSYLRYKLEAFGPSAVQRECLEKESKVLQAGRVPFNDILRAFACTEPFSTSKTSLGLELKGNDWASPNQCIFLCRWPMPWGARPYVVLEETTKYILLDHQSRFDTDAEKSLNSLKHTDQQLFHAADRPIQYVAWPRKRSENVQGFQQTFYVKAPKEYTCYGCQRTGHHYQDACFLFEQEATYEPVNHKIWSTQKCKPLEKECSKDI